MTDQSGVSQRAHLEQVERQTGKTPVELEEPDFPSLLSHIWSAFIVISSGRTGGFSGPNPITFEQILAWKELTQSTLDAREVEVIKRLDVIYLGTKNDC